MVDVSYTAERLNQPPIVPNPATADPNYVLIASEVIADPPRPSADGGNLFYRVTGFMRWVCKVPPLPNAPLYLGVLPWLAIGHDQLVMTSNYFQPGIADDSQA